MQDTNREKMEEWVEAPKSPPLGGATGRCTYLSLFEEVERDLHILQAMEAHPPLFSRLEKRQRSSALLR